MALKYVRENKGKSLLIAGIVLMWLFLWGSFNRIGYLETWELWGVPAMEPVFRDFQLIPGSAESFRRGFEPTVENPYDPGQRIFNYPAFWRLFFYTNITVDDTVGIVVILLILYFISVILFPQKIGVLDAVLLLLIVFSPASMLLYERGNADLVVFILCVSILFAAGYSANLTAILIVFGAIVKMFPLLGVTVLLRESRKRFWSLAAICMSFMVIYGLLTLQSQDAAWNTTMRGDGISYGSFVLITRLGDYLQTLYPGLLSFGGWQVLFEALALVLILLGVILGIRQLNPLDAIHERHLAAFRMGASIYVGTFLLGNNWDYRLAFLVLVIPQLSEWLWLKRKGQRAVVIGVVIAVILSCWHFYVQFDAQFIPLKNPVNRSFVVDEFINWLLVPGFAYLLAASFPDWLRHDLRKFLGMAKTEPAGA